MSKQYGLATESMVPVRASASEKAEMVHQLLFGETVRIQQTTHNWMLIQNSYDGYEGWVDEKMITPVDAAFYDQWIQTSKTVTVKTLAVSDQAGTIKYLPAGSEIGMHSDLLTFLNLEPGMNLSGLEPVSTNQLVDHVTAIYLHTPYLWGGRSPFGLDCSGFTQVACKLAGISIPRDASEQASDQKGMDVPSISSAKTGDLAFFGNEEGRITHVGILIDHNKLIHASGRVRIDRIDKRGIYREDKKKYTHSLRLIKRFW